MKVDWVIPGRYPVLLYTTGRIGFYFIALWRGYERIYAEGADKPHLSRIIQ